MTRLDLSHALAVAALMFASQLAAAADDTPPAPGAALYKQYCSTCHDHPKDRIPSRETIGKRSPEEVVQALTTGIMRVQAGGLTMNDRNAVATFVTGKAPGEPVAATAEKNLCARRDPVTDISGPQWNGWGRDLDNSRYQPQPGITPANVPRLKLKWAFGYRGSSIYGQPTVVGGRVYATSASGRVYSLDAHTGCTNWTFDAQASARTAMSVAAIPAAADVTAAASNAGTPGKVAVFFGDDSATVYALDATTGAVIWKKRLDEHPAARISGAPVFYAGRLYVPVSSLEELSAAAPGYECCKFRGSVAALDARNGSLIWQTYTIDSKAKAYRKAKDGTQLYGPAGAAIWSAPTLDPKHKVLYVGTGNSYTDVPVALTDSVLALDMDTGRIVWANQLTANDNFIVGCQPSTAEACFEGTACQAPGQGSCPLNIGPDVDFGTSPILRTLPDGRQLVLTGQKSGVVHALDPADGKQVWEARVGTGTSVGGIEWGGAADAAQMYVAVSDVTVSTGKGPGGLTALRIDTGREAWHTRAPAPVCSWGSRSCTGAQSQAVSVIPGVVFSGSHDGHLRAFSTANGRIVWDVDTALTFETVNGIAAAGGSLDHGGPTVAGGMLYVNSGYGRINGQPGNVLLAYAVESK
jgi:polyvinyl alcohol dehydrogenase (cytochrome)